MALFNIFSDVLLIFRLPLKMGKTHYSTYMSIYHHAIVLPRLFQNETWLSSLVFLPVHLASGGTQEHYDLPTASPPSGNDKIILIFSS